MQKSKTLKFCFLLRINISTIQQKISREIQKAFEIMLSLFSKYFSSLILQQDEWVINQFVTYVDGSFTTKKEDFVDVKNNFVH